MKARKWVDNFVQWYNEKHLHSAIGFVAPSIRHKGKDEAILIRRKKVYNQAKEHTPMRWSRGIRNWEKITEVQLNPEKCKSLEVQLRAVV